MKPKQLPKQLATQGPSVWAVKRGKRCPQWMPDEVVILLAGDKGAKGILHVAGWSITAEPSSWSSERVAANLVHLKKDWAEEFGTGWDLVIR